MTSPISPVVAPPTLAGWPGPWLMSNAIRHYDWGSLRTLAELQQRPVTGRPEAELWMGAHTSDPSALVLPDGRSLTLAAAIDLAPAEILGPRCLKRFGPRLPYLLKVLAVERALSIQVHPTAEQALTGFIKEQAAGVPPNLRTYTDPHGKPEMLVAVDEFTALAGLRSGDEVAEWLTRLDAPALAPVLASLRKGGPAAALAHLATWPSAQRHPVTTELRERLVRRLQHPTDDDERTRLTWALRLADQHLDDPLAIAPGLFRMHNLAPGEALYLPGGVPHAYLSGTGIEIMGSSDNVVRGGLTAKRVDGTELTNIVDPDVEPVLNVPLTRPDAREVRWSPPVHEFSLSRIEVDGGRGPLTHHPASVPGPEILFCLHGAVRVQLAAPGGAEAQLGSGQSAFLAATSVPARFTGRGVVFCARMGGASDDAIMQGPRNSPPSVDLRNHLS